ncbi:T-cell activation inhibitor, mitochondrial isoform X1 [Carcharodon carcharias]|uniref:T-cell activation inhibitor, mitochondrial isoform X1 n=1 Tax=Carcharodon carcharias TaxID=13397 RepID=UPI001B7E1F2A|nr:T-cell activation inhibitor, mitochondrial isoform X1 [Carcharodon carcharias]
MFRAGSLLRPLRVLGRFCSGRASQQTSRMGTLSVTDAVTALRPFYFAVHPDFFGQYPREREVNENSLKQLNSYLERMQRPGQKALQPTQLTFYLRDTDSDPNTPQRSLNTSGFRAVTFTLQSKDLLSTVVKILKSCSLPTDHVQDSQVDKGLNHRNGEVPFSRPIRWDKTYYSFTGYRDPEEELDSTVRMEPALRLWLHENMAAATERLTVSIPLRDELDRLKTELCQRLEISDIRWQRSWGVAHRCSQLHSLARFCQQNSQVLCNVKGCILIFADNSGMNAAGQVMLGTVDVHHHWTKLLERLPIYYDLHSHLSVLKERTSYLLGDVELIYDEDLHPTMMLEDYYRMLKIFHQNLAVTQPLFHPRSLKGLQVILENDSSAPSLLRSGQLSIPVTCDPTALQWFILAHAQRARTYLRREEELEVEQKKLISDCTEKFGLKRLYKEPSVSSQQMVKCCQRLFEGHINELQGMHLCISHFYSVLQDGDLCMPWDWKQ